MFCKGAFYSSLVGLGVLPAVTEAGVYKLPITRTSMVASTGFLSETERSLSRGRGGVLDVLPLALRFLHLHSDPREDAGVQSRNRLTKAEQSRLYDDDDDYYHFVYWSMYTIPISIGNPPLHIDAILDTSWSTPFVPSINCTNDPDDLARCINHPLYNSSASSTYRANSTLSSIFYSSFTEIHARGFVSEDSLHVAGMEIRDQLFEEVVMWHDTVGIDRFYDSAFGLALHPTIDGEGRGNFTAPSPFQNMVAQGLLDENIFTIKYGRTDREKGEVIFGGLPPGLKRKDLVEIALNHGKPDESDQVWRYYTMNGWQIPLERMSMTSDSTDLANSSDPLVSILTEPHTAVIASSFPWIGLPYDVAKKLNGEIGVKQAFDWVECYKRRYLPDWTIEFGNYCPGSSDNKTIVLTPWDYLIEQYDPFDGRVKCVSAFFALGEYGGKGFVLLGSAFLNGLYSVWDADRQSISFGNRPRKDDWYV